jgi:hypothetical protein
MEAGMGSGAAASPTDKSRKDDALPPVTPEKAPMPVLDKIELSSNSEFKRSETMPSLFNDTNDLELLIVSRNLQSVTKEDLFIKQFSARQ